MRHCRIQNPARAAYDDLHACKTLNTHLLAVKHAVSAFSSPSTLLWYAFPPKTAPYPERSSLTSHAHPRLRLMAVESRQLTCLLIVCSHPSFQPSLLLLQLSPPSDFTASSIQKSIRLFFRPFLSSLSSMRSNVLVLDFHDRPCSCCCCCY